MVYYFQVPEQVSEGQRKLSHSETPENRENSVPLRNSKPEEKESGEKNLIHIKTALVSLCIRPPLMHKCIPTAKFASREDFPKIYAVHVGCAAVLYDINDQLDLDSLTEILFRQTIKNGEQYRQDNVGW